MNKVESNEYFINIHENIAARQKGICPKCKGNLYLADSLTVINSRMYCGKCAKEVRQLDKAKAKLKKKLSLSEAKTEYDRVRRKDK